MAAVQLLPRDSVSELSQKGFGDSISEYSVHNEMNKSKRYHSYSELHKTASIDSISEFSDRSYKNILRAPFDFRGSVSEYAEGKKGQLTPLRQDSISEIGDILSETSLSHDAFFRPIVPSLSDHHIDAIMLDSLNRERFSCGAASPLALAGATFDDPSGVPYGECVADVREQVALLEARMQGRGPQDGKRVAFSKDDSGPPTLPENSPYNLKPTVSQHLVDDYTTYNIWNGRFQHGCASPPPLYWKDDGLSLSDRSTSKVTPPTPPRKRVWQPGYVQYDHESARPPNVYPRSTLAADGPIGAARIDSPHPRPLGSLQTWSQSEKGEDMDDDSSDETLPTLPEDFPADKYPIYMAYRQIQETKIAAGPGYLRGIENLGPKDHESCPCHFLTLPRRHEALSWTNGIGQPMADRRDGATVTRDTCPGTDTSYPDSFCKDCQCQMDVCSAEVRSQIQANQRDMVLLNDDEGSSVDGPLYKRPEIQKVNKLLENQSAGNKEVKGKPRDAVTLTSEEALLNYLGPVNRPVAVLTTCARYYRAQTAGVHERD